MLSSVTGLPAYFVRKAPKKYGTERVCEGGDIAGRNLVIVEDVVTTGGQVVLSAQDLRSEGGVVEHALCVIDRQGGGTDVVAAEGIALRGAVHDVRARGGPLTLPVWRLRPADCGGGGGAASASRSLSRSDVSRLRTPLASAARL